MKTTKTLLATVIAASVLSACGGEMLSQSDSEKHKLIPDVVLEDPMAARPSPSAPVMKTDGTNIVSHDGSVKILTVGVELDYGRDSTAHFDALDAIADVTAGAVRIVITPETKVEDLEAALVRAATLGLTVNLALHNESLYCKDNGEELLKQVKDNWFGKFLPIIAQDRYQSMLLISIARGWGPSAVFDPTSSGYREYMDYSKTVIRDFRKRGFKLPLVVEAPGCGEDYNAFDANRVRELLQADTERNLVFGLAAKSPRYRANSRLIEAADVVRRQKAPVIFTELGGSDVVEKGPKIETLIDKAFIDGAVVVNPEWQGPDEKVAYLFPLSAPIDIKNSQLSLDINFAETYSSAEFMDVEGARKMGYQVYLRDSEERYASLQWHEVDPSTQGWNTLSYTIGARMPTTGWVSEGFDMTQVVAVGVELIAQDKPATVSGPIKIDNIKIIEGTGPAVIYSSDFSGGSDGWANSHWKAVEENAVATLSSGQGESGKALGMAPEGGAFEITNGSVVFDVTQPFTVKARIYIPASFTNYGMGVFATQASGGWAGGGWGGSWNLPAGQWSDYSFTTDIDPATANDDTKDMLKLFADSKGQGIGFQFNNFTAAENNGESILIEDIQIISASGGSGETEFGVQHSSNFNDGVEGWVNLGGWENAVSLTMTASDGVMSLKPNAAGTRVVINKANHASIENLNFAEGFKASVTIKFPESLRDKELDFQIFFQDSAYQHNSFAIDPEEIVYGEFKTYTITPEFNGNFNRSLKASHMGLDMSSAGFAAGEEILVSSFILEGQIPVEAEEVIRGKLDFNREVNFTVDFVDGAISEDQANKVGVEIVSEPIGWFASTWFTSDESNAGYNMVTNFASSATLTERGEQVVNLPGGLLEMRTLLGYEKPAATPAQ